MNLICFRCWLLVEQNKQLEDTLLDFLSVDKIFFTIFFFDLRYFLIGLHNTVIAISFMISGNDHFSHHNFYLSWKKYLNHDDVTSVFVCAKRRCFLLPLLHWSKIPLKSAKIRFLCSMGICKLCIYTLLSWLCSSHRVLSARLCKCKTWVNMLNFAIRSDYLVVVRK